MSYQAYLDNIKAKTGKTADDFKQLAAEKGLSKYSDVMSWLKSDFDLGHGHANLIAQLIKQDSEPQLSAEDMVDQHFTGAKAGWRPAYDNLLDQLKTFGPDVSASPAKSYINLLRGNRKFGIVQMTGKRMDIGIKLKDAPAAERLEAAGTWNQMVTHRVRVDDAAQIDGDLIGWLKQAYETA